MNPRAALRAPVRPPFARLLERVGGGFAPSQLFASGEQGGWWDPSDFSTMFQDSAGTTPVTATGQPVGLIRDKSGRGNHRTQSTAASRPTLQQDASGYYYLAYDGVDDSMGTGAVDFTATANMGVFLGWNKQADAGTAFVMELSPVADSNSGAFYIQAPSSAAGNNIFCAVKGASTIFGLNMASGAPAPLPFVGTLTMDLTTPSSVTRRNGAQVATAANAAGGNFGNYPLFFGRRNNTSGPFNGREYQTIIRGAASSALQIQQAERFVGSKMGIAL